MLSTMEIDTLIELSDADSVYCELRDMGDIDGMAYIEYNYM